MKKYVSIFLTSLFFMACVAWADAASDALEKNLGHYTSYQAHFSQVNYDNKNHAGQKSQGKVFMLRPGRFRWETQKPYEQTVIANGDKLWIYDVDLAQATQQSLSKRGFNPAQLLTESVSDLTQKFSITENPDGWFQLTPKKPDRGFKTAYLQFRNNELTGLKIINQLNQTNVFNFTQIQMNPALSPALFNFKPPAGVQILKGN
jgi:outer membrane lipoprotein carrier protein